MPGGALNLKSINPPRPWSPRESSPSIDINIENTNVLIFHRTSSDRLELGENREGALSSAVPFVVQSTSTTLSARPYRYQAPNIDMLLYRLLYWFLLGSGVPRNFFRGGSTNSVEDRGQRERGSGGDSPLVRGSGGSCNLVQEISFQIVKFS